MSSTPLLPVALRWRDGRPFVDLLPVAERFSDPFWDHTVDRALRRPLTLLCRRTVPLEALEDEAGASAPLAGLIFHLSRCGSTLITRMLAAVPGHVVASEPSVLEALLDPRGAAPWDEEQRIRWLRALILAFGRRRFGDERRLFVKLSPWLTLLLPLVRRAFPEVPWIFVCREPVEVLVSNLTSVGGRALPGMVDERLTGLALEEALALSPEDYLVRLLAGFCETALRDLAEGGRVVDYRDLPEAALDDIPRHFGLALGSDDLERMRAATAVHAKNPLVAWRADSAQKQREAAPEVRAAAEAWLRAPYAALQAARQRQRRGPG